MTAKRNARREHGAALIVSLILLMVLTVLAISTMRTASLQLLMAGNVQYRENAYRLAQTGIDQVLRLPPPVVGDCSLPLVDAAPVAVPELGGRFVTSVCSRGESPGMSSSLKNLNYEVTSTGITDQRDARARLVQGYAYQVVK
jgi:PilX N-terminal